MSLGVSLRIFFRLFDWYFLSHSRIVHSYGDVTHTAERLTIELSLPLQTKVCRGQNSTTQPSPCGVNALTHCASFIFNYTCTYMPALFFTWPNTQFVHFENVFEEEGVYCFRTDYIYVNLSEYILVTFSEKLLMNPLDFQTSAPLQRLSISHLYNTYFLFTDQVYGLTFPHIFSQKLLITTSS